MIIKNKFLISLIDNLMNELHDSHFFSELDLRFKDMFGSVVAIIFQIIFCAEIYINDVFLFF